MSIIEEIRRDREDLARVLEKHPGIRKLVEDLYPDSAHFIYELLQNAEDTGASNVRFVLCENKLVFEHDGRPFDETDIRGITDIGAGTKTTDSEMIGRFGIGFKAVFAYTEAPRVWSPTFSFEISKMVLPSELATDPTLGKKTRFEFPFDSPKKSAASAFAEVEAGLREMSESTLLFLSRIESIHWQVAGRCEHLVLLRVEHSEHHIEILKESDHMATESSHFLRFSDPVEGLEEQATSIAFALEPLPDANRLDPRKTLAEQFRIMPALGRVAVYFSAEKETSGLRFHLHAPFVPELSRASIKDTLANAPLFRQLATLTANSLFTIRDLGFLNADFLSVLPNPSDSLPTRYECIRESIVDTMNTRQLTPTNAKRHAPAEHLLQAKASLKALIVEEDIEFLVGNTIYEDISPAWAIGATRKNSKIDRFLSSLAITDWDVEQFVDVLEDRLNTEHRYKFVDFELQPVSGPDTTFLEWIGSKSDEWHQKLYALLYGELAPTYKLDRLNNLCLVRIQSGKYRLGKQCYFPTDESKEDRLLPRVAMATYTSGRSKVEQSDARKLLEAIGVREVGECEQVEAILKQRYSGNAKVFDGSRYTNDMTRFVSLVEADPTTAKLFKDYCIFERADGKWTQPDKVYLDAPYLDTGLDVYYRVLGDHTDCAALGDRYRTLDISGTKIVKFARLTGVVTQLKIVIIQCRTNPEWEYLRNAPGSYFTWSGKDCDFTIKGLDQLLERPTVALSRLIWRTLCNLSDSSQYLRACYRYNRSNSPRYVDSLLLHQLRDSPWIPQDNDSFVRPAEASRSLLPEGFPYDSGWPWIKAVQFGERAAGRFEESYSRREAAKALGFRNDEALRQLRWFAALNVDDRRRLKEEHESRHITELPDQKSNDPERRSKRVGDQAKDAPERVTRKRSRSVSANREAVKEVARLYLRQQYTNGDGIMICQVCKEPLPFTLADGSYFFESVEFLPELEKHHYQNYLTLCPNHAAMYQHANDDAERMKDLFLDLAGNELEMILARENTTVYFTRTHMADLRTVITYEDDTGHKARDVRRTDPS